jgi:hypothetical protein
MVQLGRPSAEVVLSAEERQTLERWAPRAESVALALGWRILLACAEGETNVDVATGCRRRVRRGRSVMRMSSGWS